jgi:deoxyribodipyrimidine photo-lyase
MFAIGAIGLIYLAGNDPRKHRYFNIQKQANDYDKDRSFRDLWLQ